MTDYSHFNLRVYGLWLKNENILVNKESIRGQIIQKFPGGGVNKGEGLHDTLRREWKEELDLGIEIGELFFVNTFLQASAWDESQVFSFYFWINGNSEKIENKNHAEESYWLPVSKLNPDEFQLPIDKIVARKLVDFLKKYK